MVASGGDTDPGLGDDPETAVLQLYTSGTTGRPKGVVAVHRNLYNVPENFELYEFGDNSVSLNALPLFHIAGSGWTSTCLSAGLHLVLLAEMKPALVAQAIARFGVTHAFLVPSAIGMLLELPDLADHDLSSLQVIAYGASPITPTMLARTMDTLKCRLVQRYGMTETMGALTALRADDHDPHGARTYLLRSAGTPLPGTEVQIRDIITSEPLPQGATGEIVSRSRNNVSGYWRRDAETAALYTADGFLRTGDAGHIDEDGYLFVTDRVKDMIITGGENVYPVEVEAVLAEHPAVAEVAVVGLPDERWGEAVTAVVRLVDGAQRPTEAELVAFTTERLASYKKPQRIHIVGELPRNASGKILKRALRDTLGSPKGHHDRHRRRRRRSARSMGSETAAPGRGGPTRAVVDPRPDATQPAALRAELRARPRYRAGLDRPGYGHRGVLAGSRRRCRADRPPHHRRTVCRDHPPSPRPFRSRTATARDHGCCDRDAHRRSNGTWHFTPADVAADIEAWRWI